MKATSKTCKFFIKKKLTVLGIALFVAALTAIWLVSSATAAVEVPSCVKGYGTSIYCSTSASASTPASEASTGKVFIFCGVATVSYSYPDEGCTSEAYSVNANISSPAGTVNSSQEWYCSEAAGRGPLGAGGGGHCLGINQTTATTPVASISNQTPYQGVVACGAGASTVGSNASCAESQDNTTLSTPVGRANIDEGAGAGTPYPYCPSWDQVKTPYACAGFANP